MKFRSTERMESRNAAYISPFFLTDWASGFQVQTTCRVAMALNAVEIQLVDHIVVADGDYVSMVQSGYRLDEGSYYGQIQAGIGL